MPKAGMRAHYLAVSRSRRIFICLCLRCGVNEVHGQYKHACFCRECGWQREEIARKAIAQVHRAQRQGLIPKAKTATCVDCGAPGFDNDHRDYMEPLKVVPVCRSCNQRRGPAFDDIWRSPSTQA